MDNNTIDKQFTKVIESLGYSKDELKKYLKIFDLPRKIKTIASTYSLIQRKEQVSSCLDELKSRNSLLYLLFLRNTLETMVQLSEESQEEIWNEFLSLQGIDVMLFGYNSNNSDFLNNLLELTIFIHNKRKYTRKANEFLFRILQKFDLLDKALVFSFINIDINKAYLLLPDSSTKKEIDIILESYMFPRCYCNTFLKKVTDLIFSQSKIGAEIAFLLSEEFELSKLLTAKQLTALQGKFIDKEIFMNLVNKFNKENNKNSSETVREVILIKNNFSGSEKSEDFPNENKAKAIDSATEHSSCSFSREINSTVGHSDKMNGNSDTSLIKKCPEFKSEESQASNSKVTFIDTNLKDVKKLESTVDELTNEIQSLKLENSTLKSKITVLEVEQANSRSSALGSVTNKTQTEVESSDNKPLKALPKGMGLFGRAKSQPNDDSIANSQQECTTTVAPKGMGLFGRAKTSEPTSNESSQQATTTVAPKGMGLFGRAKTSESTSNEPTDKPKPKFGFGNRAKSFQPSLVSDKSYSGIKWKKASKTQNQIFNKINYENIEKLFNLSEFDQFESKARKKDESLQPAQRTNAVTSVIDPKKSYALNIALGRVKLSNTELISNILKGTFENENLIKQLIIYYPTAEEHDQICKSNSDLGRAELMFKEIKDLDEFLNSLLSLRFKFYFNNKNYTEIIISTTESLKRIGKSTELVNLFAKLLVIGNILNSNSFNGNAEGFSLDSLSMFTSKEILEIVKKKTDIKQLLFELFGEQSPTKLQFLTLTTSIETVIAEFNEAKSLFGEFVDQETSEKYKRALSKFEELNKTYKELQSYFGETDDSFIPKLEAFLRILRDQ